MSSVTTTRTDVDVIHRVGEMRDDLEHSFRELYYLYQSDGKFQYDGFAQLLDAQREQIESLYFRFPELGVTPNHIVDAPTDIHDA